MAKENDSSAQPDDGRTPAAHEAPAATGFTLAILLQHVGKLLNDHVRQGLGELGLNPSSGQVLHVLAAMEGITQQDLAQRMRLSAPTMSGILRRMQTAKLLDRRSDPRDERVLRLYLTDHGRTMGRAAEQAFAEIELQLLEGLASDQVKHAHLLLRALRDNLGGRPPRPDPPVDVIIKNPARASPSDES